MLPLHTNSYTEELQNPDITIEIIEKRLSSLTNNNKIENINLLMGKVLILLKLPFYPLLLMNHFHSQ